MVSIAWVTRKTNQSKLEFRIEKTLDNDNKGPSELFLTHSNIEKSVVQYNYKGPGEEEQM